MLWHGFELLYTASLLGYVAGLVRRRCPPVKLLLWSPLGAILVFGASVLLCVIVVGPLTHRLGVPATDLGDMLVGTPFTLLFGYLCGRIMGAEAEHSGYRRGAVVSPLRPPRPGAKPGGAILTLAGIAIPPEDEAKHFKILGATGTGKSTAIREILSGALARGDRAVIADPDGAYLDIFHDAARGDVILNPFEPASCRWDLFGEVTHRYDVEQLARSLIPDMGGEDRVWSEYARTFFTAVAQQLLRVSVADDRSLYRLIRAAPAEELRKLLAGTSAGPFLEEGSEKMFGSLRSVASSAVRALEYTTEQQAQPLSVRQWVRQGAARQAGGRGGVLFLPYRASQIAALRSVISAWMRLGIFEAMERPAADQHLWFVVDELDALGAIDGLKDALARLRKFGGRCVLGFQSIAQVSGTYGREVADTLVENCGNTLILRCSASERGGTSEFASNLIGRREVMHTTRSRTRNSNDWLPSTTVSEQLRTEPAVMASEIERLADLNGFLKLASDPDWQRVELTPARHPTAIRDRKAEPAAPLPVAPLSAAVTDAQPASSAEPIAGSIDSAELPD